MPSLAMGAKILGIGGFHGIISVHIGSAQSEESINTNIFKISHTKVFQIFTKIISPIIIYIKKTSHKH